MVYYHEETGMMFHHFEYVGDDFEADMKRGDSNPIVKVMCVSRFAMDDQLAYM